MKNTLTVKRPSPTTVLYKVSTRSATSTVTTQVRRTFIGLVRILIGLTLLCILTAKAHTSATPRWKTHTDYASTFLPPSLTEVCTTTASRIPWLYLAPVSLILFSVIFKKGYTTESLLVIRGMGVQTTTSSPTYLSTATTRFIPTNMIQDIFVYEAFKGFEVRFYLAIVVEGEHDVVVVFPVSLLSSICCIYMYNADSCGQSILPRRRVLEEVWRGAKSCLYEPKS
jgi:phosphatidylinositol glycan class H protein